MLDRKAGLDPPLPVRMPDHRTRQLPCIATAFRLHPWRVKTRPPAPVLCRQPRNPDLPVYSQRVLRPAGRRRPGWRSCFACSSSHIGKAWQAEIKLRRHASPFGLLRAARFSPPCVGPVRYRSPCVWSTMHRLHIPRSSL